MFYKDETCLEHLGFYDLSLKGITVHPTNNGLPIQDTGKVKKYEFQLNIPKIPKVQEGTAVYLSTSTTEKLWYWIDGIIQWTNIFKKARLKNKSQTEDITDLICKNMKFDTVLFTVSFIKKKKKILWNIYLILLRVLID